MFSALPMRAMRDKRLNAEHFRVLMVVAFHDRFGRNGTGCYAGNKKMAEEADCNIKSLSRTLRELAEWGYITAKVNPLNKKTRIYNVAYAEPENGSRFATNVGSIGNSPATCADENGNNFADEVPQIGSKDFDEDEQNQRPAEGNISCEAITNHGETYKTYSGEPAPRIERTLSNGELMARIERKLKTESLSTYILQIFAKQVSEILEGADASSKEYGQSERLLGDIESHLQHVEDVPF